MAFKRQSTYTSLDFLESGDIIENNKTMFSTLTVVLQKTLTSMSTQLHEHSKCQMERVNKLTDARQLLRWRLCNELAMNWLQGALLNQKILIIQIVGMMMMKIMIAKIASLSMTDMVAFAMKPTWQPPFCLIRRPHHLQWQQQVSQKIISWWIQSSKSFLNPTIITGIWGSN